MGIIVLFWDNVYVAKACLELLNSNDPPASAFQVAGTTGVHHCVQQWVLL
jgi:hypothetical protein